MGFVPVPLAGEDQLEALMKSCCRCRVRLKGRVRINSVHAPSRGQRWTEDGGKAAALDYCHKTADAIALEAQALDEDASAAPRRRGLPLPPAFVVLESAGIPVEGDR